MRRSVLAALVWVIAACGSEAPSPPVSAETGFADFDDDGDMDVYIYCLNGRPLLIENRLPKRGGFLQHSLQAGGKIRQAQEMRVSSSFLGTNDPRLHWGLGAAAKVEELTVEWPGGERQTFTDLAGNHLYRLARGGTPILVR